MRYVALIRGINVGGNSKVEMRALKAAFERAGMSDVRTYINSGNVIFSSTKQDVAALATMLEQAVFDGFGVDTRILLRDAEQLRALGNAIPSDWVNNADMKCDVVFLGDELSAEELIEKLGPRPGIEDTRVAPGAIVWRVMRADATRSRLVRMVGTPLYKQVTVRNCNTVRKLLDLMLADA